MEIVSPVESARIGQRALLVSLWTGVAISFCFLVFRIYVRLRVFRRLHLDDAFVLLAWFTLVANAAVWQMRVQDLYLSVGAASGQIPLKALPPNFLTVGVDFLHATFASYVFFYTSLWGVKISFLLFFRKLGDRVRSQKILWWSVSAFTMAAYFVSLGLTDGQCLLAPSENQIAFCLSSKTAFFTHFAVKFSTFLDIFTDTMIIGVSANVLRKVKFSLRKKLALIGICSLTTFVIVIAIIRVAVATNSPNIDLTWLILCGGIEASVAIIVACLASFRTLYTKSGGGRRRPPVNMHDVPSKLGMLGLTRNGNTLGGPEQYSTYITTGSPSERWSTEHAPPPESSQEYILPPRGVHVRQDFIIIPNDSDIGHLAV